MKYIVTETEEGLREMFTFPNTVEHKAFAEIVGKIKNTAGGGYFYRVQRTPISAGFIDANNSCHGKSYSLDLDSWGAVDTELLLTQNKAPSYDD